MNEIKIGYARVSTLEQDVAIQRDALVLLGIDEALDIFVPLNQVTEVEGCRSVHRHRGDQHPGSGPECPLLSGASLRRRGRRCP